MADIAFTWDDFWASYSQSSPAAKQDLLDQLDVKHLIKCLSLKEAIKVLRSAPSEIQKPYLNILNRPVPTRTRKRITPKQLARFVAR